MKKFYFTFGTDDKFPYGIDDYVLVQACSYTEAVKIFRKNYPDVHEGIINCAFIYAEDEWNADDMCTKYYSGKSPVCVLSRASEVTD